MNAGRPKSSWRMISAPLVACTVTVLGCSAGTTSKQEFEREWGAGIGVEDLFGGSDSPDLVETFAKTLGGRPIRARRLAIYPSYAILVAQDPKKRDNLDSYTYADGLVGDIRSNQVGGSFEADLFTLDDVALGEIPVMIDRGVDGLKIEGAHPSYIVVQKENGAVRVRIYFSSGLRTGSVSFDARGALKSTDGS